MAFGKFVIYEYVPPHKRGEFFTPFKYVGDIEAHTPRKAISSFLNVPHEYVNTKAATSEDHDTAAVMFHGNGVKVNCYLVERVK